MPHIKSTMLALLLGVGAQACAQTISLSDYLTLVEQHSPPLRSSEQEVMSAQAQTGMARLRPDPELTLSRERQRVRTGEPRPNVNTLELSWELETGGKRDARIRSAESGVRLAKAEQQKTRQERLLEAADAFIQACHDQHALQRQKKTLHAFARIENANRLRHKAGDISAVEWRQSRLEHDRYATQVRQAETEVHASLLALNVPLGHTWQQIQENATTHAPKTKAETTPALQCDFLQHPPALTITDLPQLIASGVTQHASVRAAQAAWEHAQKQVKVAQAERWVNPTIAISTERIRSTDAGTDYEGNPFDAAHKSRTLMFSVSMPLPLSRHDRGTLVQAHAAVTQAMLTLQQSTIEAEAELRAAWHHYQSSLDNAQRYHNDILPNAKQVLESMHLAYRNGSASLLELLNAQHAEDEIWLEGLQALTDLAKSAVKLQTGSGQRPHLPTIQHNGEVLNP